MKTIDKAFCDFCQFDTPQVEVIRLDIMNDESWSEPRCKYCFEDDCGWEELYG